MVVELAYLLVFVVPVSGVDVVVGGAKSNR